MKGDSGCKISCTTSASCTTFAKDVFKAKVGNNALPRSNACEARADLYDPGGESIRPHAHLQQRCSDYRLGGASENVGKSHMGIASR